MILIYAYISHYKNYNNQAISFDSSYSVTFENHTLSITYNGKDRELELLRNKYISNLHLLVGKTGSGKTNLLQLIGESGDVRANEFYDSNMESDGNKKDDKYRLGGVDKEIPQSYFLLYRITENEFLIEYCNIIINQLTANMEAKQDNHFSGCLATVHFKTENQFTVGETQSHFKIIKDDNLSEENVLGNAVICNSFDNNAFTVSPYEDDKDLSNSEFGHYYGLFRMITPYHRASLWQTCKYIRNYVRSLEPGEEKKKVSLVLKSYNFADAIQIDIPEFLENEYLTFRDCCINQSFIKYDKKLRSRYIFFQKMKKRLSPKQMFIHDLWTDYAIYLRKWIEIHCIINDSSVKKKDDNTDAYYQEFIDYNAAKNYEKDIDFTDLPDFYKMSIPKRLKWLCMYIDRFDFHDPHGVLWQIWDDIKDICDFLEKLDDKYFTIDTCTIPVVDMDSPAYRLLFDDMFERMEQYHPDNIGIFSKDLLPYHYTRLSTGEYQYAKIMGIVEDFLKFFSGKSRKKVYPSKIILLDEPETFMHPELARNFMDRLLKLTLNYKMIYAENAKKQGNEIKPEIQIIIGTHSPFFISDVLPQEVTKLDIDHETGNAIVLNRAEKEYFGANIHTILADSFFLKSTIGEFSRNKLKIFYEELRNMESAGNVNQELLDEIKCLIPHIGDELLQRMFKSLEEEINHGQNQD